MYTTFNNEPENSSYPQNDFGKTNGQNPSSMNNQAKFPYPPQNNFHPIIESNSNFNSIEKNKNDIESPLKENQEELDAQRKVKEFSCLDCMNCCVACMECCCFICIICK